MAPDNPVVAVTMGEPAGIGPELILQAWTSRREYRLPPFIALADPRLLRERADALGLRVRLCETDADHAGACFPDALPVRPLSHRVVGLPGSSSPGDAPAVIEAIRTAVELVRNGDCAAVVTAPIAKAPLLRAGFPHPGHTEFLGELARELWGHRGDPVMLLWSSELAVVPVTVHIPLARVPTLLSTSLIVQTARTVALDLERRFGLRNPRLALTGLNPHAGESGTMGREEQEIIAPAVAALQAEGIAATGPHPADTLFHAEARRHYDVALAMYHDQALIPIKTLAFDRGVNVTLGLPFVRTSPDHGTAFDIAGSGRASSRSLIEAMLLAGRLAKVRTEAAPA